MRSDAFDPYRETSQGIVVNVWYNRTVWPKHPDQAIVNHGHVPLTKDFADALFHGHYIEHHKYESVYAEWWGPDERDWCEEMWSLLQNNGEIGRFPIEDRSMCVGDIVTLSRVTDFAFAPEKLGEDNGAFAIRDIAAWNCGSGGFNPCPAFLRRLAGS